MDTKDNIVKFMARLKETIQIRKNIDEMSYYSAHYRKRNNQINLLTQMTWTNS